MTFRVTRFSKLQLLSILVQQGIALPEECVDGDSILNGRVNVADEDGRHGGIEVTYSIEEMGGRVEVEDVVVEVDLGLDESGIWMMKR